MKKYEVENLLQNSLPKESPDFWDRMDQQELIEEDLPKVRKHIPWYRYAMVAACIGITVIITAAHVFVQCTDLVGDKCSQPPHPLSATLGLSPLQPVELMNENVTFTKSSRNDFDVKMEYKVKTERKTEFVLPFVNNYSPCQIMSDSAEVTCQSNYLPYTRVCPQYIGSEKKTNYQTIFYLPDALKDTGSQPDDTYQSLMNLFHPSRQSVESILNTKFRVYDVSDHEGNYITNFQIDGYSGQRCLMFSSQVCSTSFHKEKNDQSMTCHISDKSSVETYWLAVPVDADTMQVNYDGTVVLPMDKTLNEILEQCVRVSGDNLYQRATCVKYLLNTDYHNNGLFISGDTMDNVSVGSKDYSLNMLTFDLDQAGEHTITIEFSIPRTSSGGLQWIDSPQSLWSQTGQRSVTVIQGDKTYTYPSDGTILNFKESNQQDSGSDSAN